ncbi:MAG: hypothetical protein AAF383_01300 [Cyanobacteria bacterium P01_A01_bin.83]
MNTHNYVIDKNLPVIEPLYDTWGGKKSAGYWGLDGELEWRDFSAQEINAWFAESLAKTLDAFSSLARISHILWRNGENNRGSIGFRLELESYSSYEEYLEKVFQCLKNYPILIEEIEIQVDMFVYVRTNISPNKPIRSWVRGFGDISINIDQEDEDAGLWLNMEHTLFYPFSYQNGKDNSELFELNQPLLKEALKNWEQKFNSRIEVEGLPGIYKYGFLPEDQW